MSFPSESDMVSKEFQNSDLIFVNLMIDVFKIIVKYRRKIIAKHRHLLRSGNRALGGTVKKKIDFIQKMLKKIVIYGLVQQYSEFLILLTFEIA